MASAIKSKLDAMKKQVELLEEKQRIEAEQELLKKKFPLETLDKIVTEKRKQLERNSYSSCIPLAKFYDQEKLDYLQPILDALTNIHKRLDDLEKK